MSAENNAVEEQVMPERRRAAPSSTNLPLVDERTANEQVRALFARYPSVLLGPIFPALCCALLRTRLC